MRGLLHDIVKHVCNHDRCVSDAPSAGRGHIGLLLLARHRLAPEHAGAFRTASISHFRMSVKSVLQRHTAEVGIAGASS